MAARRKLVFVLGAAVSMFAGAAYSQDSPSLGDLARQKRQQSKAAQGKDAKASKVITNEEIPEHAVSAPVPAGEEGGSSAPASSGEAKQPAEHWKSQIQAQKSQIASCKNKLTKSMNPSALRPPTALGAARSGTSGSGKSSSKSSACSLS